MAQTMATTKCMRERVMAMAITTRDYEREDSVRTWAATRSDKTWVVVRKMQEGTCNSDDSHSHGKLPEKRWGASDGYSDDGQRASKNIAWEG